MENRRDRWIITPSLLASTLQKHIWGAIDNLNFKSTLFEVIKYDTWLRMIKVNKLPGYKDLIVVTDMVSDFMNARDWLEDDSAIVLRVTIKVHGDYFPAVWTYLVVPCCAPDYETICIPI